jgi:hypothetical protein
MQRRTIMIADCRSLHLTLSDSSSADLYTLATLGEGMPTAQHDYRAND